jgi:hypothetical protein
MSGYETQDFVNMKYLDCDDTDFDIESKYIFAIYIYASNYTTGNV